jgi:hypothetical protein
LDVSTVSNHAELHRHPPNSRAAQQPAGSAAPVRSSRRSRVSTITSDRFAANGPLEPFRSVSFPMSNTARGLAATRRLGRSHQPLQTATLTILRAPDGYRETTVGTLALMQGLVVSWTYASRADLSYKILILSPWLQNTKPVLRCELPAVINFRLVSISAPCARILSTRSVSVQSISDQVTVGGDLLANNLDSIYSPP